MFVRNRNDLQNRYGLSGTGARGKFRVWWAGLMLAVCSLSGAPHVAMSAAEKLPPKFSAIREQTRRSLARRPEFEPDDLISRGDIRRVLLDLHRLGWETTYAKEVWARGLPDSHFLVRELRDKKEGKQFMRQVARHSGIFGQLDRYAGLPGGQKTLRALIDSKDGHKLIDYYMTRTRSGNLLLDLLPRHAHGTMPEPKDFRKPTGRIYTQKDLLKVLAKVYQLELLQAAQQP